MVILDRSVCSPTWVMGTPSIQIPPSAASRSRRRPPAREDFPAPVLPTMPTCQGMGGQDSFRPRLPRSPEGPWASLRGVSLASKIHPSIHYPLSICPSVHLSICPPIHPAFFLYIVLYLLPFVPHLSHLSVHSPTLPAIPPPPHPVFPSFRPSAHHCSCPHPSSAFTAAFSMSNTRWRLNTICLRSE